MDILTAVSKFHKEPPLSHDQILQYEEVLSEYAPKDYFNLQFVLHSGEGFIGSSYLRFYRITDLISINDKLHTNKFFPSILIFGSNGGGEAYAFTKGDRNIINVPFIPMDQEYSEKLGSNLVEFLQCLINKDKESNHENHQINRDLIGKEIHEITPLFFGGSPADHSNKTALSIEKYAEVVAWWNAKYIELKQSKKNV